MGYFNSAYEIYAMLCVIATAGLPVALSMLISAHMEQGNNVAVQQTYHSALRLFLTLGSVGAAAMLFFARPISQGIGNEQATYCIMAIAPALFFVCLSSAIRGYFQGLNQMLPTAISQLIEALGKLIFGVFFASIALKKGFSLPLFPPVSRAPSSCGIKSKKAPPCLEGTAALFISLYPTMRWALW